MLAGNIHTIHIINAIRSDESTNGKMCMWRRYVQGAESDRQNVRFREREKICQTNTQTIKASKEN